MEPITHTAKLHIDCPCVRTPKGHVNIERPKSTHCPDRPVTYTQIPVTQLTRVFQERLADRQIIFNYFARYNLLVTKTVVKPETTTVRRLIKAKSINFCVKRANWLEYNGGCLLFGDYNTLTRIAEIFNERMTKAEFIQLVVTKLKDLKTTSNCVLRCQRYFKMRRLDEYVLVGIDTTGNYKMSFGKREWYPDEIECTRQCALRELFEEFNVELSDDIIQTWNKNNVIMWGIGAFHLFRLDANTNVKYDDESDTIFVG